jgi:uncharacterized membrane protein
LFDVQVRKLQFKCGFTAKKTEGRVMKLKLRKIVVVLTAALPLAAAAIPTKAEAFGFLAPALIGAVLIGSGGYGSGAWGGGGYAEGGYGGGGYGGGGYGYGGYGGDRCCRRDWVPPPPPRCCYYDGGWDRGRGWGGGGYDGW